MGPQRRLGIYVGYETISIIRYLEPLMGDVFTTCFANCHVNEAIFPSLEGEKKNHEKDVSWNTKRVTKSYIPDVNAPARVEIPDVKSDDKFTQESKARLKRGRPVGSKDKNPRKRKATKNEIIHEDIVLEGTQNVAPPEEEIDDINKVVSINYAMHAELNSLNKRKVFGRIVLTPGVVKPAGYKWVFIRKRNENDEVIRYKARLVAQGFSQRPGIWIDYEETYSPVIDAITFHYLISVAIKENLDMRLMDVVTVYLYGSLDSDIYMKIPEGFKMPEALIVYVDDLNIIGTNKEIIEVVVHLKEEFEMKDLGKTKYCLGFQIEYMPNGILVHQSNYTEKILKWFNMDKAKSLSTPMVGRSLHVDNDPFRPCEEDEDVFGPKTHVATSSNHVEVIALHEASRECVWLRSMTQLIVTSCGLNKEKSLTIIHEDNAACVALMEEGYIKSNRTKHIPSRYFAYTQDLIKDKQIEMRCVQSSNNSADLFTKALTTSVFRKHVHAIGMRHVQKT
nr:hypothetical protein [Tanacetum cinerariifolium]